MIGARRLSERRIAFTQVMAPRGPFPHAGSTSPGRATARYTQTTPLRAEVVPGAAWSRRRTRDRRPQRSKQGSCGTRAPGGISRQGRCALCRRVHAGPSHGTEQAD